MQENPQVNSVPILDAIETASSAIEEAAWRAGGELVRWEPKDGPLLSRCEQGEWVLVLRQGLAYLCFRASPTMDLMLSLVRPGECLGEDRALLGGAADVEARVVTPSELVRVRRSRWVREIAGNPALAVPLLELAARRQREILRRVSACLTASIEERLPQLLHDLCEPLNGGNGPVTLPLTQEGLARIAGCRRATAHRGLSALARHGLLRLRRGAVEVPSVDALGRFAGGESVLAATR